MVDAPNFENVIRDFNGLGFGGTSLSKAAHDIEAAKAVRCSSAADESACHEAYMKELNGVLHAANEGKGNVAESLLSNFDLVGADKDALIFRPLVAGPDGKANIKADVVDAYPHTVTHLLDGHGNYWSQYSVTDGTLREYRQDSVHHDAMDKVGKFEVHHDPKIVTLVEIDPKTGNITQVDGVNHKERTFTFDSNGDLKEWKCRDGQGRLDYWVKVKGDEWQLFTYKDHNEPLSSFEPVKKPDAVWHGEMKMTHDGHFIQRKAGENITHVETINGVKYQY